MTPPFDETLAQLVERVTDAFIALDADWRFTHVNHRAGEIFRRRPEELIGHYIWAEFPEGIAHPIHRAYRQAAAEQCPVYIEDYYPPLDRWFEHRIYPSPGGISVFFQDVTERRRTEASLRDSEARLQLAVESARIGMWDWDIRQQSIKYSREYKQQLGYREDEIEDTTGQWERLVHPDDRERTIAMVQGYVEQRVPEWGTEIRLLHKDGMYRWFIVRGRLFLDDDGAPLRMIGTQLDITARRHSEEALRTLSRRLLTAQEEERRRVARELHDEVGQVLTALKIQLQSLQRASGAGPFTERLSDAVQSVDRAIGDVRGLALELRPSLLDDLGLAVAVRSHADRFGAETGLEITLSIPPLQDRLPPEVETACFRVVQEALTNVARHSQARHVRIDLRPAGDRLELCVGDDGVGFDIATARRRAADGEGMGLSGMEERVRLAGGTYDIRAQPGQGTEIRVSFPAPASLPHAELPAPASSP